MKSPLKSCVVYDLETGGLSEKVNSIYWKCHKIKENFLDVKEFD